MPNQRKKDKALIGGYVDKRLAEAFKNAAAKRGLTTKDLLEILIKEEIKKDKPHGTNK